MFKIIIKFVQYYNVPAFRLTCWDKLARLAKKKYFNPPEVRFTKVLTKYSTEYNNILFIKNLCNQLDMDRKDLFSFFLHLRKKHKMDDIFAIFNNNNYNINKLDICRIFRYLDRYTLEGYEG